MDKRLSDCLTNKSTVIGIFMNPTYRDECVRLLVLSAIKLCALIIYVNVDDTPVSIIRVTTAEESVKIWKYSPRAIPILYYWKHICRFLSPFFLLNIMYFVIGYPIYSLYLLQLQNIKVNTIQKLIQLKINSTGILQYFMILSSFIVKMSNEKLNQISHTTKN